MYMYDRPAWTGKPGAPAKGKPGARSGKPPKREDQKLKQKGKRVEHNDYQPKRKAGWAKPKAKKNARPGKGKK